MNDRIHLLLAHFVLTHLAVSIKSVNLTKSLDFSGPTIPHKTIETNKKKPLPSISVESGAHLGLNIDLGEGGIDLKRI